MSDVVEIVARADWDHRQAKPGGHMWNDMLFGDEWRDKAVPWEHLQSPHIIPSAAEDERDRARAILSALDVAGYAVVPKEPTPEMVEAWDSAAPGPVSDNAAWTNENCARADYVAMLAAAPKVQP